MELNKYTNSDFTSLFDIQWLIAAPSLDLEARKSGIWKVIPIAQNTGDSRRMSEYDIEEYATLKNESAQADRARVQQGHTKDLEQYRVAKDIGISYEERTQNKYPQVIDRLSNLSKLAPNRMELDLQHRLGFATATSYEDMDGVTRDISGGDLLAWASTAHTVRGSSATYRNRLANNPQISKGSIESMVRMTNENTINQFGQKLGGIKFGVLWTTDDEVDKNVVKELLTSTASTEGLNPGITNVYRGAFRHVVMSRVATDAQGNKDTTKRHYWGMSSAMATTAFLGVWEEPRRTPFRDANDGSEDRVTGVRAGYGIAHVTGRGNAFSTGDGTQ